MRNNAMTHHHALRILAAGLVLGCGFAVVTAAGYIDPGTGSYMLQVAIAFLVGIAFSVKVFWKKIRAFLSKIRSGKKGKDVDAA
jgi:hypothetical protein